MLFSCIPIRIIIHYKALAGNYLIFFPGESDKIDIFNKFLKIYEGIIWYNDRGVKKIYDLNRYSI